MLATTDIVLATLATNSRLSGKLQGRPLQANNEIVCPLWDSVPYNAWLCGALNRVCSYVHSSHNADEENTPKKCRLDMVGQNVTFLPILDEDTLSDLNS